MLYLGHLYGVTSLILFSLCGRQQHESNLDIMAAQEKAPAGCWASAMARNQETAAHAVQNEVTPGHSDLDDRRMLYASFKYIPVYSMKYLIGALNGNNKDTALRSAKVLLLRAKVLLQIHPEHAGGSAVQTWMWKSLRWLKKHFQLSAIKR